MTKNNAVDRIKIGRNAGIFGILCNLLLFALKLSVGLLSGSVAVIADAVNNLSDAGSSIFVFVGYIMSGRPADREHPYGHARMEYLCGLFISVIVVVLGVEMFISSAETIAEGGSETKYSVLSVAVIAATIAAKLVMAVFYRVTGKKINSQSLKASAADSLGDAVATAAVLLGLILTPYTGKYTDGVLGCAVALYIIILGLKLVREASGTLIGEAPDKQLVGSIVMKIREYEGVLGIHDLVIHSYGSDKYFATVHVEMDSAEDIMKCHDQIDNIEDDFRREMNIELVIHLDPINISDERTMLLRSKVSDIISGIAAEFSSPVSMHDFRVVFGITHSNILFDIAITNEFPIDDAKLCAMLQSEIKKIDEKYNTVITVDRDYISTRYGSRSL